VGSVWVELLQLGAGKLAVCASGVGAAAEVALHA